MKLVESLNLDLHITTSKVYEKNNSGLMQDLKERSLSTHLKVSLKRIEDHDASILTFKSQNYHHIH